MIIGRSFPDRLFEAERGLVRFEQRFGFLTRVLFHPPQPDDRTHRLYVIAVGLGFGVHILHIVGDTLFFLLEALHALDEEAQLFSRNISRRHSFPPANSESTA